MAFQLSTSLTQWQHKRAARAAARGFLSDPTGAAPGTLEGLRADPALAPPARRAALEQNIGLWLQELGPTAVGTAPWPRFGGILNEYNSEQRQHLITQVGALPATDS
jgi:hypothetical protein